MINDFETSVIIAIGGIGGLALLIWGASELWLWVQTRRRGNTPSMSKHGIVLPPPKLGLPSRLENPEKLHDYVWEHIHMRELERVLGLPEKYGITFGVDKAQFNWPYSHNIKVAWKKDLEDFNRHWMIERSRADHLEEMVDRLQQEVNDLKGNNGWLRRLFPRRH